MQNAIDAMLWRFLSWHHAVTNMRAKVLAFSSHTLGPGARQLV